MSEQDKGVEGKMYLRKIHYDNYKCYKDIDIVFNKKLNVLVGENGAGKSTILEGIVVAMSTMFTSLNGPKGVGIEKTHARLEAYQIGNTIDVQPQYPVCISADATIDNKEIHWKRSLNTANGKTTIKEAKEMVSLSSLFQERLKDGDQSLILPVVAYYGTGRLWDYHREKQYEIFGKTTRTNGYVDCVDGTANIKLMMNWFEKKTIQKYQWQENGLGPVLDLEAVLSAMQTCYNNISGVEDSRILYNMDTKELDVVYTEKNGEKMRMPLNQMSDGYKGTLSLVADIAYRMAVLNPQLLEHICDETDGIVLIDEVDLHLHPAWQRRILNDLLSIFPKVQFIVTTHAPAVINSVKKENVFVIDRAEIYHAPVETYGKDVNGILKTIMNVKERPDTVSYQFNEFYQALDENKYNEAEILLNKLDEELGDDPELAAMHVQLDLEKM